MDFGMSRDRIRSLLRFLAVLWLLPTPAWSSGSLRDCIPSGERVSAPYSTVPMLERYVDQDRKNSIIYFDEARKKELLVVFENGLLLDVKGKPITRMDFMYGMDASGEFFIASASKLFRYNHSSFFGGQPAAGAGLLSVRNGRLIRINNSSGHYAPPPQTMKSVLDALLARGVDLSGVRIGFGGDKVTSTLHRASALKYLFTTPESVRCVEALLDAPETTKPAVLSALEELDSDALQMKLGRIQEEGRHPLVREALEEWVAQQPTRRKIRMTKAGLSVEIAAPERGLPARGVERCLSGILRRIFLVPDRR